MFERYQGGEQAILVHVDFKDEAAREDLRELEMLATSAGATILGRVVIGRGSVIGGNVWLTRSVAVGSNITQAQMLHHPIDDGQAVKEVQKH